jgi:type IV pilus assembly protein PilV
METRICRQRKPVQLRGRVRGMSLIEVLVSMTIFAVGVLGLFSSHATAFNSYSDAKFRVDASLMADRLIGEMWVDRANAADYAYAGHNSVTPLRLAAWLAQLQQTLPTADAVVQINGNEVQVTVTWQPRGGDLRTHSAVATLQEP